MDTITRLHCRNAELETELRLVKEQLVHAHGATNYLVTNFSQQQSSQQGEAAARIQQQLDYLQGENAQLRAALGISAGQTLGKHAITSGMGAGTLRSQNAVGQLQLTGQTTPPSTDDGHVGVGGDVDLLSFDDGEDQPLTEARSSPSPAPSTNPRAANTSAQSLSDPAPTVVTAIRRPQAHVAHADKSKPAGLGISNVDYSPQSIFTQSDHAATQNMQGVEHIHAIEHSDGNRSFVMMTPPSSSFQTQSSKSPDVQQTPAPRPLHRNAPSGPRWIVPEWAEMHLLNAAYFAEDWDEGDWAIWAGEKGIYNGRQWKSYYAEVIRPRFLVIQAKRAAIVGGVAEAAEQQAEIGSKHEEEVVVGEGVEVDDDATEADEDEDEDEARDGLDITEAVAEPAEADGGSPDIDDEHVEEAIGATKQAVELANAGKETADVETTRASNNAVTNPDEIDLSDDADESDIKSNAATGILTDAASSENGLAAQLEDGLLTSRWAPNAILEPVHLPEPQDVGTGQREPEAVALPMVEQYPDHDPAVQDATTNGEAEALTETSTKAIVPVSEEPRYNKPEKRTYGPPRDSGRHERGSRGRGRGNARSPPPESQQPLPPAHDIQGAHPLPDEIKRDVFSQTDPADLRTVLVSNIPAKITLTQVLEKVAGGKIFSATMLRTAGMRTKPAIEMNAAMVTFLYDRDAQAYVNYCNSKSFIYFWSEEWDAPFKASISLVSTPSRQVHPFLFNPDVSRVLYLADGGKTTADDVITKTAKWDAYWSNQSRSPMTAGRDQDGILWFEFASMGDAAYAKVALDNMRKRLSKEEKENGVQAPLEFEGMSRGFLPDPCARAVQMLAEVAEATAPEVRVMVLGDDQEDDAATEVQDLVARSKALSRDEAQTMEDWEDPTAELPQDPETQVAASPTKDPEYSLHSVREAASLHPNSDLEIARALQNMFKKKDAKPPHRRSRPRVMLGGEEEKVEAVDFGALREGEVMGVEG